jgi:hypothetical protein
MTPTREEYLYKLVDLSDNFHTANYIAQVVGEIIEKLDQIKYRQLYPITSQTYESHTRYFKKSILISRMLDVSRM